MRISEEGRASLSAKTLETIEFVEVLTGWTVTDDAPPAGSPLEKITRLSAALQADEITPEEFRSAVQRVQERALAGD